MEQIETGISRVVELENLLGEVLDMYDRGDLVTTYSIEPPEEYLATEELMYKIRESLDCEDCEGLMQ